MISLVQALVVAEHLNFRHAANVLGTTQSSISARIKALEETLGILLFERRHRGVRLTDAGRQFISEVSVGVRHLDHAIATAGAVSAGMTGHLAIGLIASTSGSFIAEWRLQFREAHPGVAQTVKEASASQLLEQLRDGVLDVAIMLEPLVAPACHSRSLWTEPYFLALPASHALASADDVVWGDLGAGPFLGRTDGDGPQINDLIARRVRERGIAPQMCHFDVGRDTLIQMVADGEGIAIVTETAKRMNVSGVVFRQLSDEPEQARFCAVWSPHNSNPALRIFVDLAARMAIRPEHPDSQRK